MRPRAADLLLDLEFSEAVPIPPVRPGEVIEATTEGTIYALEIPDDDPIWALLAPPCARCGRACDGGCS